MRSTITARRQGIAIVTVLVLMTILTLYLTMITVQIVAQRHTIQQRERQLQAKWLARAGVELAAARLLEGPAPFTEIDPKVMADAKVRIVVEKSGSDEFTVATEAEVGQQQDAVIRSAKAAFRRTADGAVRLQAIPTK